MNGKTGSILIAASVVLVGVLAMLLEARPWHEFHRQEGNPSSSQTTRILLSTMPDAPMALQVAHPESTSIDRYAPEVELAIKNTSNKVVSAYAIRYDVGSNGQLRAGGVELNRISAARSLLQPGETRTVIIEGVHYSLPIEQIVVSIDFLEFTDGTTWGADTYSSSEILAGMRAGARTTTEHLSRLLTARGPVTFAGELKRTDDYISIPIGHSTKWQEGFKQGMAFIMERAKHEVRDFSALEIERVLNLPIDALDEIKRSQR